MKDIKARIVIVEDDPSFRRGMVRLSENEGCSVHDFGDAQSALEWIEEHHPDFVFCDYKLPGMNGLEFLKVLRKKSVSAPFVLVTAHFNEDLKAEAKSRGALDAIAKPLDIACLRDLIRKQFG